MSEPVSSNVDHLLTSSQSVYKTVRSWSQRVLERVGAKVMDVPLPDDNQDETEEPSTRPKDE